jgi:hypothetical protein
LASQRAGGPQTTRSAAIAGRTLQRSPNRSPRDQGPGTPPQRIRLCLAGFSFAANSRNTGPLGAFLRRPPSNLKDPASRARGPGTPPQQKRAWRGFPLGDPEPSAHPMLTLTALPTLLPFPFLPSRLLAPAELCARRLGPFVCHCISHLRQAPRPAGSERRAGAWHNALLWAISARHANTKSISKPRRIISSSAYSGAWAKIAQFVTVITAKARRSGYTQAGSMTERGRPYD